MVRGAFLQLGLDSLLAKHIPLKFSPADLFLIKIPIQQWNLAEYCEAEDISAFEPICPGQETRNGWQHPLNENALYDESYTSATRPEDNANSNCMPETMVAHCPQNSAP